jgi:IBR domain, a half RING-finger domain
MPPRCCTAEGIDLTHVDKLFDQNFKKTWNRKFDEYKTKNKVYCIGKCCGEWIKPHHITVEHGRKIGKCKRCGTRVCAICNNKAHVSRDCPKDPATKQFIETAKQKGWQKCYSCSAMVELKEGCNHMTCRCTAEFCMVCGLRWKSCDCPWFNYENVDAHLGNPMRYQEEMDRRRDQEQRDEALARRMQALGVNGNAEMFGNAAGHHMNANFIQQAREALTANYANAEQAARGLLNGWVTGRENRLPGFPGAMDETAELRGPFGAAARHRNGALERDRAAERAQDRERESDTARDPADTRPQRRGTNRRRNAIIDMLAGSGMAGRSQTAEEREQERRIQDWANGVDVS